MNFTTSSLKPLELGGHRAPARSHLLPSDMSGILTHGRHHRPAPSPLIHPDRPGRPGQPNTPHDEQLIEQARKWVAQTFFGTMLKQMRNSPFKSPLFEGGRGGQAFGELYDQHLVDRMSSGVGNKLVGAIVRKIVSKNESSANAAKASTAYARQSTLGPATSTPGHQPGANQQGQGARQFAQKRRPAVPASGNPFQNVRMHVAPGL